MKKRSAQPRVFQQTHTKPWRCKECHFDNCHLLPTCELCQAPKSGKALPKHEIAHQSQLGGAEPSVTAQPYKATPSEIDADANADPLVTDAEGRLASEKVRIEQKTVVCQKCSLLNNRQRVHCLSCEHILANRYGFAARCRICHQSIIYGGQRPGKDTCSCKFQGWSSIAGSCLFCDRELSVAERLEHSKNCQQRLSFFDKDLNSCLGVCTDLQKQTILSMHAYSEEFHLQVSKRLLLKLTSLGYNQKDLENLHHYIIHFAPIIVHFRAGVGFEHFLKDTHYRNAIEMNLLDDDNGRIQWEDRLFYEAYHEAKPSQRVKYGTMNFTNDPRGVATCSGYGESYFLLKEHVRDRCTITDRDSSLELAKVGTFRFMNHILIEFSDKQLRSAVEASRGKQMQSEVVIAYKEIQIHGPIEFARDIHRAYLCKQEANDESVKTMVKEFCDKNGIDLQEFDQRKRPQHVDILRRKRVAMRPALQRFIGQSRGNSRKAIREQKIKADYGQD